MLVYVSGCKSFTLVSDEASKTCRKPQARDLVRVARRLNFARVVFGHIPEDESRSLQLRRKQSRKGAFADKCVAKRASAPTAAAEGNVGEADFEEAGAESSSHTFATDEVWL